MAITVKLTEDFEYREVSCRLLEIRADSKEERDSAVKLAKAKGWSEWIVSAEPLKAGKWGAVLEKGMPEQVDVDGLLELAEQEELLESFSATN